MRRPVENTPICRTQSSDLPMRFRSGCGTAPHNSQHNPPGCTHLAASLGFAHPHAIHCTREAFSGAEKRWTCYQSPSDIQPCTFSPKMPHQSPATAVPFSAFSCSARSCAVLRQDWPRSNRFSRGSRSISTASGRSSRAVWTQFHPTSPTRSQCPASLTWRSPRSPKSESIVTNAKRSGIDVSLLWMVRYRA